MLSQYKGTRERFKQATESGRNAHFAHEFAHRVPILTENLVNRALVERVTGSKVIETSRGSWVRVYLLPSGPARTLPETATDQLLEIIDSGHLFDVEQVSSILRGCRDEATPTITPPAHQHANVGQPEMATGTRLISGAMINNENVSQVIHNPHDLTSPTMIDERRISSDADQHTLRYMSDNISNIWQPEAFTSQDIVDFLSDTIPNLWQPRGDTRLIGSPCLIATDGDIGTAIAHAPMDLDPYAGPAEHFLNRASPLTGLEHSASHQVDMNGGITKVYSLMILPELVDDL
jgi:hypothetical protein